MDKEIEEIVKRHKVKRACFCTMCRIKRRFNKNEKSEQEPNPER